MGSEIRYSESEQLMTDEDLEIMKAVERFCANVTVPVLHEVSTDVVDQVGTGTLFEHNGRLLLITARHIFDEISPEDLVLPSTQTTELHGIGPYELYRPDDSDVDIAIVELRHEPTIQRARAGWRVLDLSITAIASPNGHFILSGYPSERGRRIGGLLGGSLLTLHTERLTELPEGASGKVISDLDLFFRYEREGFSTAGEMGPIPHLGGCSGGSIWEYREPEGMRFWNAEQSLRIVAVQSSFFSSRGWFRAKSWNYVRTMIDRLEATPVVDDHPSADDSNRL